MEKLYSEGIFYIYKDGKKYSWYTESLTFHDGTEHALESLEEYIRQTDAVIAAVRAAELLCTTYKVIIDSDYVDQ